MARQNFSWGVQGVGKQGVDYGNTNDWGEDQWQQYEGPSAKAASPGAAPVLNADNGNTGINGGGIQAKAGQQYNSGITGDPAGGMGGPIALGDPNAAGPVPTAAVPSNGLKAGWEAGPGPGLVKNSATGQVVDINHPVYQQSGAAPATPAGGTPAAPGAPGAPGAPAPPATVNDAYKQLLLQKLTMKPIAGVGDDPALQGQANAFQQAQQRATERQRAQMAETAALEGTGSAGGTRGEMQGLEQQAGEATGRFNAGLVGQAAQQQKDELMRYAAMAGGDMNADQSRALQERLASLDADIRKSGLQSQQQLGEGDLNLRLLLGLMGNNLNRDQLGANMAQFNANRDDTNLWKLLGGL